MSASKKPFTPGDDPRLPVEYILQLKSELDGDLRLQAELPQRIEQKKRRLEAAMVFAPDGFDLEAQTTQTTTKHKSVLVTMLKPLNPNSTSSWIGEVAGILSGSQRGMSHQEILTTLKRAGAGLTFSKGDKGFYNAIARLTKSGDIIKSGGLLYSAKLAKEMQARGETLPDLTTEVGRRRNGSGALVLKVLEDYPKGLPGPEIRKIVSVLPEAPKSMREHGQYIYNILGTLMGSGSIMKKDGVYRVAKSQVAARKGNGTH